MTDAATLDRNLAVVRMMIERADAGDLSVVEEVWAPDIVVHFGDEDLDGSTARALIQSAMSAFPDMRHEVEDLFAVGDKVVMRGKVVGTHQGDFQGVPASGQPISVGQMVIFRLADGRIAEYWEQADFLALMQQIGALPSA